MIEQIKEVVSNIVLFVAGCEAIVKPIFYHGNDMRAMLFSTLLIGLLMFLRPPTSEIGIWLERGWMVLTIIYWMLYLIVGDDKHDRG